MIDCRIHSLVREAAVLDSLSEVSDLSHHDSRCIRIGHNLLKGHPEVVAAELASIQQKPRSFSSFLHFRFMRRSFKNGREQVKSLVSVIINMKNASQAKDAAKFHHALKAVGCIMDELIRDEGHVRKQTHHTLKMTVCVKQLGSQI